MASRSGRAQSRRNVLRAIYAAVTRPDSTPEGTERVDLHDLRHSFVAVGFDQGLTGPEVAALARHASARVTLTVYAGITDDGRGKAIAKLTKSGFGA